VVLADGADVAERLDGLSPRTLVVPAGDDPAQRTAYAKRLGELIAP
jgi:hypothetical protein